MKVSELLQEGILTKFPTVKTLQDYFVDIPTGSNNKSSARLEALWPMLSIHCKEIISAYKSSNVFLLRGVSTGYIHDYNYNSHEFASTILKDRDPKYLNSKLHKLINEVMEEMNLQAHRGNSIFCSTDEQIASSWGNNIFIIFPKDGFKFTTFTAVNSSFYMYDYISNYVADMENAFAQDNIDKFKKFIKNKLKELKPQNENISKWLPISHEYMISGDSYIGLQYSFYNKALIKKLNRV